MPFQKAALVAELAGGHPTTGAYNADNQLAADELNALNRPAPASVNAVLEYLLEEKYRSSSAEGQAGKLYGRIVMVSQASSGGDPFAITSPVANEHIAAANAFLRLLVDLDTIDVLDVNIEEMLDSLVEAECIGNNDKTAIQGLAQNVRSRVAELNADPDPAKHIGRLIVNATHVADARS